MGGGYTSGPSYGKRPPLSRIGQLITYSCLREAFDGQAQDEKTTTQTDCNSANSSAVLRNEPHTKPSFYLEENTELALDLAFYDPCYGWAVRV